MKQTSGLVRCAIRYAPLIELAQLNWIVGERKSVIVQPENDPVDRLTSAHFNLIQLNAQAWTYLFLFFRPLRPYEGDEGRIMTRAGVVLPGTPTTEKTNFIPLKIGVYNRDVS